MLKDNDFDYQNKLIVKSLVLFKDNKISTEKNELNIRNGHRLLLLDPKSVKERVFRYLSIFSVVMKIIFNDEIRTTAGIMCVNILEE